MKKNIISLCLLVISLVIWVSGCTSDKQEEQKTSSKEAVIGVLLYKADDTYVSYVKEALERSLQGKADVTFYNADNEQFTQDTKLIGLLEQGVDALAINLVDVQAASFIVDSIKKTNIPVVFFNREPNANDLKLYSKAFFVGTTPQEAGQMQGEIIQRLWQAHPELDRNQDGAFQYIMVQANSDNPEALARTETSVKTARELGVPLKQIGSTFMCGWDEQRAYEATRHIMAHLVKSVELIISNNDAMALGVLRSLQEQGFNSGDESKYIPIIGVDATPEALRAIEGGYMTATVRQDSEAMGRTIATLLLNLVHNRPYLEGIELDWDASGVGLRVPHSTIEDD